MWGCRHARAQLLSEASSATAHHRYNILNDVHPVLLSSSHLPLDDQSQHRPLLASDARRADVGLHEHGPCPEIISPTLKGGIDEKASASGQHIVHQGCE